VNSCKLMGCCGCDRTLQEFLTPITDLQIDPADAVRVELAAFLGEAAAVAPRAPVLQSVAAVLAALAVDPSQSVVKAAISVAAPVFRTCFAVVALQVGSKFLKTILSNASVVL
jgi:hypothetical protein